MTHGLWIPRDPLILASTSPTRRMLLADAGLDVLCIPSEVDERGIESGLAAPSPQELAVQLARMKASAVAMRHPGRVVVGADQVLALGSELLHKPADAAAATSQLMRLSGRTHHLHAAVAIAEGGRVTDTFVETAALTMRSLDAKAIAAYVALAGEARVSASVGAYQLEGLGIHLFERIEGNHTTILGLPMLPLLARLRDRGLLRF